MERQDSRIQARAIQVALSASQSKPEAATYMDDVCHRHRSISDGEVVDLGCGVDTAVPEDAEREESLTGTIKTGTG